MSRSTDYGNSNDTPATSTPLPVVDWQAIGCEAPVHLPIDYQGPQADLPEADVFVVTWTTAEWSAFDHVFFSSDTEQYPDYRGFQNEWHHFEQDAPSGGQYPLWGEYQMVGIKNASGKQLKVLLFHSECHLAYSPYLEGLTTMVQKILSQVKPQKFISIGTSGACNNYSYLGDTVVTNAGYVDLSLKENVGLAKPYNHTTITGSWFPESALYQEVKDKLYMPLNKVCTWEQLDSMIASMHEKYPDSKNYGLDQLLNDQINPDKLNNPNFQLRKGVPLKTTDAYYIAPSMTGADQYAVLEMDDAVLAHFCKTNGTDFVFYRNISDPVIREYCTIDGTEQKVPASIRSNWSGEIYNNFGFFTSFNGALTCYAGIAGME